MSLQLQLNTAIDVLYTEAKTTYANVEAEVEWMDAEDYLFMLYTR